MLTGQPAADNFDPRGARFRAPGSAQWVTELDPVACEDSPGRASHNDHTERRNRDVNADLIERCMGPVQQTMSNAKVSASSVPGACRRVATWSGAVSFAALKKWLDNSLTVHTAKEARS